MNQIGFPPLTWHSTMMWSFSKLNGIAAATAGKRVSGTPSAGRAKRQADRPVAVVASSTAVVSIEPSVLDSRTRNGIATPETSRQSSNASVTSSS